MATQQKAKEEPQQPAQNIQLPKQAEQALNPKKMRNMDKLLVTFTFINACVGSGVLQLGKICKITGYSLYIVFYVLAYFLCQFVFHVFSKAAYHGNFPTISEALNCLYGKTVSTIVDVSLLLQNAGFLTTYINVASDYIRDGIKNLGHLPVLEQTMWKNIFKVIISVFVMLPLSLLRKIDAINIISSFALVIVVVAMCAVLARFGQYAASDFKLLPPENTPHPFPNVVWITTIADIPQTIAYFCGFFSRYSMHTQITPMQKQLNGKPFERRKIIVFGYQITMVITTIIYMVIGVVASMMFDRSCTKEQKLEGCIPVDGNILLNFGPEDVPMTIIKLLYSIVILVSFPCMIFPVKVTMSTNWFHLDIDTKMGYFYFCLIGIVVTLVCLGLSVVIPNIDKVSSLTANIFGIVINELVAVFIWYKMPLLEQNSFGEELDTIIEIYRNNDDEESQEIVRSFIDDVEAGKTTSFSMGKQAGSRMDSLSMAGPGHSRFMPTVDEDTAKHEEEIQMRSVHHLDENKEIQEVQEKPLTKGKNPRYVKVATDTMDEVQQEMEKATQKKGAKPKTHKEKFVEKYVLKNLSKEPFIHSKKRTVWFVFVSVFFVLLNVTAIVCEFFAK